MECQCLGAGVAPMQCQCGTSVVPMQSPDSAYTMPDIVHIRSWDAHVGSKSGRPSMRTSRCSPLPPDAQQSSRPRTHCNGQHADWLKQISAHVHRVAGAAEGKRALPGAFLGPSLSLFTKKNEINVWHCCSDSVAMWQGCSCWAWPASDGLRRQVLKMTNPKMLLILDGAIRTGAPMLMEDIEEMLDPALDPVLLKAPSALVRACRPSRLAATSYAGDTVLRSQMVPWPGLSHVLLAPSSDCDVSELDPCSKRARS